MTALVLADDHSINVPADMQRADVLICGGDVADWVILKVAAASKCQQIFAIKGNHDSSGPFSSPIADLHLVVREFGGLRFGGFNGSWKYKPRGNYLYEQFEVEALLKPFPAVDVFVAHNSPRLIHERDEEVHIGFTAFNTYIERMNPRLFIHGHQHVNQETRIGSTQIIGVFGQRWLTLAENR